MTSNCKDRFAKQLEQHRVALQQQLRNYAEMMVGWCAANTNPRWAKGCAQKIEDMNEK